MAMENDLSTAKAMAVMEVSSKRILYSKNMEERLPMASTTKIITAIVAIENNYDLDRLVEITTDGVGIEGTSIYLRAGEKLTIRELLYGLMLRSGNDAAVAIAKATSGSVDAFVQKCNEFVKIIGAENTHLVNPHGLPDDGHFTTAKDLAIISAYALQNSEFAKIVSSTEKRIENVLNSAKNRVLKNKNKLLLNMEGATGVKTGYTKKAGRCFVGSAKRNGMELVCVLLDCSPMFEECQNLLEKGFSEFKMIDLLEPNSVVGEVMIENGYSPKTKVVVKGGAKLPLKVSEVDDVQIVYDVPSKVEAPKRAGDVVGKFEIYASKDLIFSDEIYIIEDVKSKSSNFGETLIKDFVHLD